MPGKSWTEERYLTNVRLFEKYVHDAEHNPDGMIDQETAAAIQHERHPEQGLRSASNLRDNHHHSWKSSKAQALRNVSQCDAKGNKREYTEEETARNAAEDAMIEATRAFKIATGAINGNEGGEDQGTEAENAAGQNIAAPSTRSSASRGGRVVSGGHQVGDSGSGTAAHSGNAAEDRDGEAEGKTVRAEEGGENIEEQDNVHPNKPRLPMVHFEDCRWVYIADPAGDYHAAEFVGDENAVFLDKTSDIAQYGGQVFEVWFSHLKTATDEGFRDVMICDRAVCNVCFEDANLPERLEDGSLVSEGRNGDAWCHSHQNADIKMWETVKNANNLDQHIGTRVATFGQERLQMYDEDTKDKVWSEDFQLTKLKVEDGTVVDCWICKKEDCEWCKSWNGRSNKDIAGMMATLKAKHSAEEEHGDEEMV